MEQVHVFIGGTASADMSEDETNQLWRGVDGTNFYPVSHNSIDFTGLIYIVEHPKLFKHVKSWFYMHHTTEVGPTFWSRLSTWCPFTSVCAIPLTRSEPSFNMGLYDARFLNRTRHSLLKFKQQPGTSAMQMKKRGVQWEDAVFHMCDEEVLKKGLDYILSVKGKANSFTMCPTMLTNSTPTRMYSPQGALRIKFIFPCLDLMKTAANWQGPQEKMVLSSRVR